MPPAERFAPTVHVLRQIDVGDSIDLEALATILRAREPTRGAKQLRGPDLAAKTGVVLEHRPLDVRLGKAQVGEWRTEVRARLFEFGVVAFRFSFEAPEPTGDGLIELSSRLASGAEEFDEAARTLWLELRDQARGAVVPWEDSTIDELMEDFIVFVLPRMPDGENSVDTLGHILLGEPRERTLAPALLQDVKARSLCYYEEDFVFVDYEAAVVVDEEGGSDLVDIFEIASAQLLELRFYEVMLKRSLARLSREMRHARSALWLFQSPFHKLARRAAIVALEIGELSDRLEGSITLVGDTYSVHVYRETALRFRLADLKTSVREKLTMISRVAEVIGHDVQARRDTWLEATIVLLIVFEIVMAFVK